MVSSVIPQDKRVFIAVRNHRCIVARFRATARHEVYAIEEAANWRELEDDARRAVETQVGAITHDEHYPCPERLAMRAAWPED